MTNSTFISGYAGYRYDFLLSVVFGLLAIVGGVWFFEQFESPFTVVSVIFGFFLFLWGFALLTLVSTNWVEKPIGWIGAVLFIAFCVVSGALLVILAERAGSILQYFFACCFFIQAVLNVRVPIKLFRKCRMCVVYFLNGIVALLSSVIFAFHHFSSTAEVLFLFAMMIAYWGASMMYVAMWAKQNK